MTVESISAPEKMRLRARPVLSRPGQEKRATRRAQHTQSSIQVTVGSTHGTLSLPHHQQPLPAICKNPPVNDCLIFHQPKDSGLGVALLRLGRDRSHLHKAEAHPVQPVHSLAVFVKASRQSQRVAEPEPEDAHLLRGSAGTAAAAAAAAPDVSPARSGPAIPSLPPTQGHPTSPAMDPPPSGTARPPPPAARSPPASPSRPRSRTSVGLSGRADGRSPRAAARRAKPWAASGGTARSAGITAAA